eukprot:740293-Amphidinium_carterae.1
MSYFTSDYCGNCYVRGGVPVCVSPAWALCLWAFAPTVIACARRGGATEHPCWAPQDPDARVNSEDVDLAWLR